VGLTGKAVRAIRALISDRVDCSPCGDMLLI
jgi:hypothetical protein